MGNIFVKVQVDELKNYFNKVIVISAIPYFPKLLKNISFLPEYFRSFSDLTDYSYDNVFVYYSRFLTLPFTYFKKRNRDYAYRATLKCIEKKKLEFDLIHAHFAWMPGYIGAKLKHKYKLPLIVTLHGSSVRIPLHPQLQPPSFKGQDKFLKKNLDYVFEVADAIITNHPELNELIINNYNYKTFNKLHIVDKEIDIEIFDPYKKLYKENAEKLKCEYGIECTFNVLFLARLTESKDPLTFVSAAFKMKEYDDIRFILVGGGNLLDKIVSIKKEKNIANLIIVGPQNNGPEWYLASDVFCALDNIENIWSGTVQEALCLGTPVIIVNTQQVTKHLRHNIDTYIIPVGDSDALISAIIELKKDPQSLKKLSNKKDEWRYRFDSKRIAKEIIKIYSYHMNESLIKNKSINVLNNNGLIYNKD